MSFRIPDSSSSSEFPDPEDKISGDELDEEDDEVDRGDEFCIVSTISSRMDSGGLISSWMIVSPVDS